MPILAHGYLLVILLWSPFVDSLLFCKFWHSDGYNCSNTCLYAVWSTLYWFSCITSRSSLSFCLMSSLSKGESMGTKLIELFANWVVERRNMINDYLRRRACIERVRGSWFQGGVMVLGFCVDFEPFLLFVSLCGFPSSRWHSWAFLCFLGLLAMLYGILDSNFKLCAFVVNGLIKGEIEKPSGLFLGLIVMSHWLGEVWIRIRDSFVLFFFYLCFVQRIAFAYLVVCRW
jgi:hypothetical protein